MNIIHEKLERLDQAILNGANAAELRGYIVDIRDHLAARQERDLTTELEILRSEYSTLTREHEALKAQLQDTKSALERATAPKVADRRSEQEEKILLMLTGDRRRTGREIASELGTGTDRAEVLLHALDEADLVGCQSFYRLEFEPAQPSEWYLTTDGKRYLAKHDLIQ